MMVQKVIPEYFIVRTSKLLDISKEDTYQDLSFVLLGAVHDPEEA